MYIGVGGVVTFWGPIQFNRKRCHGDKTLHKPESVLLSFTQIEFVPISEVHVIIHHRHSFPV